MTDRARDLALAFSAGSLGGLANSLVVWLFGALSVTAALGVSLAPDLTPGWLYPRLVWGGLWAVLFVLPILERSSWWARGLAFSLGPTAVQLFIVFPFQAVKGILGLDLGLLTPIFVILLNAVWGLVAATAFDALQAPRRSAANPS